MRKKVTGYLTVEATCIMSLTISLYVLIIVFMFLTYDKILLDQNMAMMAVDCKNSLLAEEEIINGYSDDKYIWMRVEPMHYLMRGSKLKIEGKGEIPGVGFDVYGISQKWKVYANTYELWFTNPITMLRLDKLIEENENRKEEDA